MHASFVSLVEIVVLVARYMYDTFCRSVGEIDYR